MADFLLWLILFLVAVVLLLLLKRGSVQLPDLESAFSRVWRASGLDTRMGELAAQVRDIRDAHRSIERMLRTPTERGPFGEVGLEAILADQLPPDMYGIRQKCLDGKVPDAFIRSTVGLICIDSKFPLESYLGMVEADEGSREALRKEFLRDVTGHLEKVRADYVCPDKGSAPFAFAYIPSEAVYYSLVSDAEAYLKLREFARHGVQVVSPLTLSHKLELVKTGVHARRLSEKAERVRMDLERLGRAFREVEEVFRVFEGHFRNAGRKVEELDRAYRKVRDEFDRLARLENGEATGGP